MSDQGEEAANRRHAIHRSPYIPTTPPLDPATRRLRFRLSAVHTVTLSTSPPTTPFCHYFCSSFLFRQVDSMFLLSALLSFPTSVFFYTFHSLSFSFFFFLNNRPPPDISPFPLPDAFPI